MFRNVLALQLAGALRHHSSRRTNSSVLRTDLRQAWCANVSYRISVIVIIAMKKTIERYVVALHTLNMTNLFAFDVIISAKFHVTPVLDEDKLYFLSLTNLERIWRTDGLHSTNIVSTTNGTLE